ncbi:SET domain-containing protein [Neobacillus ginsengisoli]|uniref:SET domain-containing protein n=1 Tax=Neobacillus ginsengisoli TaxID=904295 RepID=A0ABT9XXC6_9BACI|nr:SET domain-containing protein [Neobacillus ginsengisoli]MDQ0200198.1 SET domain-containing protein [Neobacillus ginsengisoli]
MLEVKQSKYGRGVFATHDIQKGELIHTAPVIIVPNEEFDYLYKTILSNYFFYWGKNKDCAIALGYGSLFNHSYTPNAKYKYRIEDETIEFYAHTDIKSEDEIVVNYNGNPEDKTPVWFEVL